MSKKIRILFSIETNDKWIFDAYRGFYDSLSPSNHYEVFCTVCNSGLSDEQIEKYNVIDYAKISKKNLNSFIRNSIVSFSEDMIKQAEKFSIWANPNKLLERFCLFRETLSFLKPDVVIVWNGMADIRGMIGCFLAKQKVPFFYAEKGMLPESWYIDENGINAECSLNSSFLEHNFSSEEVEKTKKYIQNVIESGSSAWEQPERIRERGKLKQSLSIGPDSKMILFPGQVDEDVNVTRFSGFKNVADAVKLILDSMPEKTYLVVKPHPKSKEKSKISLAELPLNYKNLRIIDNINVWDIIDECDLVISINSTVAFEALLRKKKVILLGDGVLSKTGLCKKVNNSELGNEIKKYIETESFIEYSKVLSFVNFLRENYYIFRNIDKLPDSVLSKIEKKATQISTRIYNGDDIIKILYNKTYTKSNEIDDKESAIDCFLKAKSAFDKDNYIEAMQFIEKYKSLKNYTNFERKTCGDKGNIGVSVVIVTYNRKDDLIKCLETVSSQNTGNYEIIVVDNGGCDYESIKQYVNQYIKCPINFNLSEGRNIGVHYANGKIIAFLDDDALVESNYISSTKSAFDKYNIFGLRGKTLPKNPPVDCIGSNIYDLGNNPFPSYCNQEGNSAWLRDIYMKMEGMDPLLFGHEGSDLTYRIIKKYNEPNKIIYWPETIIYHNYPTQEKSKSKYVIHQRSSNYLKYKHNANIFANRKEIEKFQICIKQDEIKTNAAFSDKKVLTQSGPKVSIVIACHNCEKYLPKCVESIQNQIMKDWELFLVDDSSSDNTKNIIEKFSQMDQRIRPYFFDDNTGPYVRRNFAIERAKSDFIVIQDSDDIMNPEKLDKLYNEITKNERLGIVGSFYLMALDEFKDMRYCDKIELPVTHNEILENYNSQVYVCWHGSAIIRKSLFETVGLYDEHPYGSDKFWLAKAANMPVIQIVLSSKIFQNI
jgi:glycosyltransferase involved in cell wall biosynthesis